MTSDERDGLVRLRREGQVLRMVRDLLSRAAAFFAGGTSSRKRRSRSSMWALASFPVAFAGDRLVVSRAGDSRVACPPGEPDAEDGRRRRADCDNL